MTEPSSRKPVRGEQPLQFIFLHGGGQGGWVWDQVIVALNWGAPAGIHSDDGAGCARMRRQAAAQNPGMRIADVVEELVGEVAQAQVRGGIIVGHSQAGIILPAMMVANPAAYSRAVFIACCAPLPGQSVDEMMGGRRGDNPEQVGRLVDPAIASFDEVLDTMFCNDMTAAQRAAFVARLGGDAWPAACRTQGEQWPYEQAAVVPSSFVVTLKDAALPVDWQMRFAARLRTERLVEIDAGHQVMQTQPERLARLLLAESGAA